MLKPTVPGIQIPGGNQPDDSPAVITAQTRARILGWAAGAVMHPWDSRQVTEAADALQKWLATATTQGELKMRITALQQTSINRSTLRQPPVTGITGFLNHADDLLAYITGQPTS